MKLIRIIQVLILVVMSFDSYSQNIEETFYEIRNPLVFSINQIYSAKQSFILIDDNISSEEELLSWLELFSNYKINILNQEKGGAIDIEYSFVIYKSNNILKVGFEPENIDEYEKKGELGSSYSEYALAYVNYTEGDNKQSKRYALINNGKIKKVYLNNQLQYEVP